MPDADFSAAVIVAAGSGKRFGAADKILTSLCGRPLLSWSLDAAERCPLVDAIVVVAAEHTIQSIRELASGGAWPKLSAVVLGGKRRQDSVMAGLNAVPPQTTIVAVHDAARPFAADLFVPCLVAAIAHGAAIAAIPVPDTLKRVDDGTIRGTLSREGLWAAQTPQAFRLDLLREAVRHANQRNLEVTDESAVLEVLGIPVIAVTGSTTNLKVTRPEDLALAEAIALSGAVNLAHSV